MNQSLCNLLNKPRGNFKVVPKWSYRYSLSNSLCRPYVSPPCTMNQFYGTPLIILILFHNVRNCLLTLVIL